MQKGASYYESLIRETPLFTIDKNRNPGAYTAEFNRLVEYLYLYLIETDEKKNEPYALEIVTVAKTCIENFDTSKGEFLHYFNRSWSLQSKHIFGEEQCDKKARGMKLTEDQKRGMRSFQKYAKERDGSESKQKMYERIAEQMDVSLEKVMEYAQLGELFVAGETATDADDEDIDIWELVAGGTTIEQEIVKADSVSDLMDQLETAFGRLQDRQKPLVADLLTARFWPVAEEMDVPLGDHCFLSVELIENYRKTGVMPTQRQIAEKYKKNETSLSRTMAKFLEHLKEAISGDILK